MMSAPRIRPLTRPSSELMPSTNLVRTPSAIVGPAPWVAARASSKEPCSISSWSEALSIAASTDAPISSVWSSTPFTVATMTTVIRRRSPSTIRPAAREGLEPAPFEAPHRGLEDHGQDGREEQREQDLAHVAERGDDDDRRHHDAHEAPRQDADLGGRGHGHRSGIWPSPGWASAGSSGSSTTGPPSQLL
jgi:hypothetical protein